MDINDSVSNWNINDWNVMPRVLTTYNSKCLCCKCIEEEMIKVGCLVFCEKCFRQEFQEAWILTGRDYTVSHDSNEYKKWLKVYIDMVNKL